MSGMMRSGTLNSLMRSETSFKKKVLQVSMENELEEDLDNELRNEIEPNKNLRGKSYFDAISQVVDKCPKFSLPKAEDIENVSWLETAYEYAALKHKSSQEVLKVDVPDTVLLKYQRPYAWFHSEDSIVRKKIRVQELTPEAILQHFRRGVKPNEIVAYFLAIRHNRDGEESPTIEYFDASALEHFLVYRMKNINVSGILQKFVPPPGHHNAMIRAWWTPHTCQLESRCNRLNVLDTSKGLRDRAVTFDGDEYQSEHRIIRTGKLHKRAKEKCVEIKNHLESLLPHGHRVWLMVLYFKVGANNKLWWLWCGSARLQNRKGQVSNKPRPLTPKGAAKATLSEPQTQSAQGQQKSHKFECIVCQSVQPAVSGHKYLLKYKSILQHFYPQYVRDDAPHTDASAISAEEALAAIAANAKKSTAKPDQDKKASIAPVAAVAGEMQIEPLGVLRNFRRKSKGGPDPASDKSLPSQAARDRMMLKVLLKNPSRTLPPQLLPFLTDHKFLDGTIEVCESCCLDFSRSATTTMLVDRRSLLPKGPQIALPPPPSPARMHIYERLSRTVDYGVLAQGHAKIGTKLPPIGARAAHTSMDGEVASINRKTAGIGIGSAVPLRSQSVPPMKPGQSVAAPMRASSTEPQDAAGSAPKKVRTSDAADAEDDAAADEAEKIAMGILPGESVPAEAEDPGEASEAAAEVSAAQPEAAAEAAADE